MYIHICIECGKENKENYDEYKDCAGHWEWVDFYYKCKCGNIDNVTFEI